VEAHRLLEFVKKVPMKIASFDYQVPFFVIDHQLSHPVILGRPFEHMSRMKYIPKRDGSVEVTITSRDRQQTDSIAGFLA